MDKTYSRIGLREVVFAELTADTAAALTYAAKKTDVVEAISLEIAPQNTDPDIQYAEDVESDVQYADPEIKATLELKELPLALQAWILNHTIDQNGVMVKKAGANPPYFAMGFKSKKRNQADRYCWLLKGRAAPFTETYKTQEGKTITRQTDKIELTFIKRTHDEEYQYVVDSDTAAFATAKATFFNAPYTPVYSGG